MGKVLKIMAIAILITVMAGIYMLNPGEAEALVVNSVTITVTPNPFHTSATVTATFNITHQIWQGLSSEGVGVEIELRDDDWIWDDVLDSRTVVVPPGGALPPQSFTITCDDDDDIEGDEGNSGENTAEIYVRAPLFGPASNTISVTQTECDICRQEMDGPGYGSSGAVCTMICAIGDTSLMENVSALAFAIGYDPNVFNFIDAQFIHPEVLPFGTVIMVDDTVYYPAVFSFPVNLTGPMSMLTLEIRPDAPITEESQINYVGECEYYDPAGMPMIISFYPNHTISVAPPDNTPPMIDPSLLHISQYEIFGEPGSVMDDWMHLPQGIKVELFDHNGDFVAMNYADDVGSFGMEHFWLKAGTMASLVATDLMENTDEYVFPVEPSFIPVLFDVTNAGGAAGTMVPTTFGLFNRCDLLEIYEVTIESASGWLVMPPMLLSVHAPFEELIHGISIEIPPGTPVGTVDEITITAVSMTHPAGYFHTDTAVLEVEVTSPDLTIELIYLYGSPVPPEGGNLNFDLHVENLGLVPLDYDAWLEIAYEGGPPSTVVLRTFSNYLPGWAINRPGMWYPIAGSYAPGNYTFTGKVGENPDVAWDESGFPFEKLGVSDGSAFVPFPVDGAPDPFDEITEKDVPDLALPSSFALHPPVPNPFNPSSVISYQLPEISFVNLVVYDITGRRIVRLINGWQEAGVHEATFDGSNLASGIYIVRLNAGGLSDSQKIVLMK